MIEAISGLEPEKAAGILARTALSLGYEEIGALVSDDTALRARVLLEVRKKLGLSHDDDSPEALQQIGDLLDAESDILLNLGDNQEALARLAESGELPSDLYEIEIIPNIIDLHGRDFDLEKDIIETTIRAPSFEQHYGAKINNFEPALISLFIKYFRIRFYLKDFYMIVAAQREGLRLVVHQAWRMYPTRINISRLQSPVEWLRQFAAQYGIDVEVNGKRGHFFLFENNVTHHNIRISSEVATILSRFSQTNTETGREQAALIVAINTEKYLKTLDDFRVSRKDILEDFVPAPLARN